MIKLLPVVKALDLRERAVNDINMYSEMKKRKKKKENEESNDRK